MATLKEEIKRLEGHISLLEDENQRLKDKLVSFKSLDEELAGKRVFEIAYKRLTTYLTVGGLFTILIGVFGYKAVIPFIENQAVVVAKKMDSTAVINLVKERLDKQVTTIGKKELDNISHKLNDSANVLFKIVSNKVITLSQPTSFNKNDYKNIISNTNNNPVPSSIDISNQLGLIADQGPEGSVVGFALADALAESIKVQKHLKIRFSARYIYNNINNHVDRGALITDGLNLLMNQGVVPERFWPYVPGQFALNSPDNLKKAPHYRIDKYSKIDISISRFKQILASNKIILVGMIIYQEYQKPDKNGVLPLYNSNFRLIGGHAATIVGYNDITQLLKLRFSWGATFGDNGYCYLHFEDVNKVFTQAYVLGNVIIP